MKVRVRSREQLLQQILSSMAVHVAVVNRDGRITYASRSWKQFGKVNGAARDRIGVGADYLAVLKRGAEQRDAYAVAALRGFTSVLEQRTRTFSLEYPCHSPEQDQWFLMRVDPMPARHGGAVVCHFNVTDTVQARRRLQESLERYELATLGGHIGVWDWELATGALRVDPALKRLLGFEAEEISDRKEDWWARVHHEDRAHYVSLLEAPLRSETRSVEVEHRKLDSSGHTRWFLSRASLLSDEQGRPERLLGLDTDITDRKTAEQELIRETSRYQNIFRAAGVAIVEADFSAAARLVDTLQGEGVTDLRAYLNGQPDLLRATLYSIRIVDANAQAVRLAGASSRQALLNRVPDCLTGDGEGHFLELVVALAQGRKEHKAELRSHMLNGRLHDIVATTRFVRAAGLRPSALICLHDITDLVSFQQRYRMATSAGSVTVIDYDLATRSLEAQAVLGAQASLPAGQEARCDWLTFVHPLDAQRVLKHERALLEQPAAAQPISFRIYHPNGRVRWLLKRGTVVQAIDGTPLRFLGTLADITTLKQSEAALRRMHRRIRSLTERLVAAQEAERRRIARELHDDINQRLAVAAISMSNLHESLAAAPAQVKSRVALLQAEVSDLITAIRRISHELHPGVLEHAGLVAALRSLCREFGSIHSLKIRAEIYDLTDALPPHVALCCYRIVQEALRSAIQPPRARHCTVRLYREGESLILRVRSVQAVTAHQMEAAYSRNNDLHSVKGRVRLLGGRLRLATRAGQGSEVRAIIPISASA